MSDIYTLVEQHKWIPLAAVIVGLVIRLLKSDTKIPITIPTRARVWLVLALGVVAGTLEKVGTGGQWTPAIVDGLIAALLAMLGHETIVNSVRGGRDVPLPGLAKQPPK